MTAVLNDDTDATTADVADAPRFASWQARAGAIALDVLPGAAVIATTVPLAISSPLRGTTWWVFSVVAALALTATLVNRWVVPSFTGWTVGRAVFAIRVTTRDGGAAGVGRLAVRDLAHLLDTAALFVGWLWPLWDKRHRTFADLLSRTEVRVVDPVDQPRHPARRIAGAVLIAAAVLSAAGGGLGYLQVYRQDRALEQARSDIAQQGPRIVEELLSYGTKTVVDDFSRAQTLATDGYRPQLIAQQQAVQKSGVTDNEYWAVSSAVLSATRDRAAMLLALQGQRGSDPNNLKFITATVRADFEKSNGRWEVAVLTVLKKPLTGQNGPPGPPPGSPVPGATPPGPPPGASGPGR